MKMKQKQEGRDKASTRQLMGIAGIKDYSLETSHGELVFFMIKPTNISVLSDASIVQMATAREFLIIIRLQDEKESDVQPYLSRIEKSLKDQGFTTRKASENDLKRLLGVYYEQNVTTEKYEDHDGERWVILGE